MLFVVCRKLLEICWARILVSNRVDRHHKIFCACFFENCIECFDNEGINNAFFTTKRVNIKLIELSVATLLWFVMSKDWSRVIHKDWLRERAHTVFNVATHESCCLFWSHRQVVTAFAEAVGRVRPELAGAHLDKPLTMLLFGMMNWMFTWMRPDGGLGYADMAPVVTDLFLGGLPAVKVQSPSATPAARETPGITA